jgi:S-formylglutathione hydrolase FrmB
MKKQYYYLSLLGKSILFFVVLLISTTNVFATISGKVEYTTFHSNSLASDVNCAISLPASYSKDSNKRYPTVFFLHGLFNDEKDWEERGVEAKLDELRASGKVGEFIVAIPYGANSFYLNAKNGARYEDAIVKDFIPFVDKNYRTIPEAKNRMIAGISMGGYGALMIAFKHPEMFAGVAAHCAALFEEIPKPPTSSKDARGKYRYELATKIYGNPPDPQHFQQNNPLYLVKANNAKIKDLKIYFDIGQQDRYGFEKANQDLDSILTNANIKHEFYFVEGEHGWSFLLSRSEPAFTFYWKLIKN